MPTDALWVMKLALGSSLSGTPQALAPGLPLPCFRAAGSSVLAFPTLEEAPCPLHPSPRGMQALPRLPKTY